MFITLAVLNTMTLQWSRRKHQVQGTLFRTRCTLLVECTGALTLVQKCTNSYVLLAFDLYLLPSRLVEKPPE